MVEYTTDFHEDDHEVDFDDSALAFKTSSVIQNDLLLSLVYFGLILFLPVVVWNHIDHNLLFLWQGSMIALSAVRWLSKAFFVSKTEKESINLFWSRTLIGLTLLDGLGWGIFGALLFPADSTLTTSLIALFLIGIGAVGAVSYSARMLIAIPYLLSVVLPFTISLYFTGGYEEFLIASVLSLLTMMFCFAADRLNIILNAALDIETDDEELILSLEDENLRLQKIIESKTNQSRNLENQIVKNASEIEHVYKVVSQYSNEQHLLAGNTINLLNDIKSLKLSELDQEQNELISRIEEKARHLSDNLNVEDENAPEKTNTERSEHNQVLVVNDNKRERKIIESFLSDLDIGYESVENVPAALAMLCETEANNHSFEIIIANMWTPEMDGISFAECLQEDPEFQYIKLILLSSEEETENKRLKKLGVDQVIKKPLQHEDLINAFNQLLEIETKNLPASIEALVDDAIQVSVPSSVQENHSLPIIDKDVIDGLHSTTTINFIEVVNEYLEEAPQLIEQAQQAYLEKNYSAVKKLIKDLGNRSLHMGATGLVESAKNIEDMIEHGGIERIMGMIQSINADFIQVESALLAELTNGALLSDQLKH